MPWGKCFYCGQDKGYENYTVKFWQYNCWLCSNCGEYRPLITQMKWEVEMENGCPTWPKKSTKSFELDLGTLLTVPYPQKEGT